MGIETHRDDAQQKSPHRLNADALCIQLDQAVLRQRMQALDGSRKIRLEIDGMPRLEVLDCQFTVAHELLDRVGTNDVVIAQYQPTMFHCKVMIVDDLLVSVGSIAA